MNLIYCRVVKVLLPPLHQRRMSRDNSVTWGSLDSFNSNGFYRGFDSLVVKLQPQTWIIRFFLFGLLEPEDKRSQRRVHKTLETKGSLKKNNHIINKVGVFHVVNAKEIINRCFPSDQ